MRLTDEEIRGSLTTEQIASIAQWVRDRRCMNCGAWHGLTFMDCGHLRCLLCHQRDRECLPCALAV